LNIHRTPKDKLDSLLKGFEQVKEMIPNHQDFSSEELLTPLILAIIKSQPQNFESDLAYIRNFRDPQQLKSTKEYIFTSCYAAAQFIRNLTLSQLNFENEEEVKEKSQTTFAILDKYQQELKVEDNKVGKEGSKFEKFEEKAYKVIGAVKQSQALKSIKSFISEAEEAIQKKLETLDEVASEEEVETNLESTKELALEEEFQLQLAMAMSLSEQELLNPDFGNNREALWITTREFEEE
jgi:hypothetical protein